MNDFLNSLESLIVAIIKREAVKDYSENEDITNLKQLRKDVTDEKNSVLNKLRNLIEKHQ